MKFLGMEISKKMLIGIIASIVVVSGGITTGVVLMNNKDNQKQEEKQKDTILLKEDLKFEINSEVNLLSLVSERNKVKVLSNDENIDTSSLGEKEITIKYEIKEKEENKTFKITIVDTQAPTIEYKKELSTNAGTKIDLLKDVKVSDNSKEEIKATIEGEYDFNKVGTYSLKYVAVDSSNNKIEEEFTLKVNEKPKAPTNNNSSKPQTNNNVNKPQNNNVQNETPKPTCNLSSGTLTANKPNSPCEYTTETATWAYVPVATGDGDWTLQESSLGIGNGPVASNPQLDPFKPTGTADIGTFKTITIYKIK